MSSPDLPSMPLPDTSDSDRQAVRLGFDNTYARLPERFYARVNPTPVATPRLVKLNLELARSLELDPHALASEKGVQIRRQPSSRGVRTPGTRLCRASVRIFRTAARRRPCQLARGG